MREWGEFILSSLRVFNSQLDSLLEYVDATVQPENVARNLAAGVVYFNGGSDKEGSPILALPNPPNNLQMAHHEWMDVINYIKDE